MRFVFPKFGALIITLLLFSACGAEKHFKDDPEIESKTGILTEQHLTDQESGSHFLTDEDGNTLPLRSLAINLSSVRYINNKIEALGFVNEEDGVFEVTGISVVELLSEVRETFGKFVEIKSSDMGFRIKYYDDWFPLGDSDGFYFYAPGGENEEEVSAAEQVDRVIITMTPFDYEPTPSTDGAVVAPLNSYLGADHPFVKLGPDSLDAVKIVNQDGVIDYFLYRNGYIYNISFYPATHTDPKNLSVLNEMLAEFRFIPFGSPEEAGAEEGDTDSGETEYSEAAVLPQPDFETATFESLPYRFGTVYPDNWYYSGTASSESGVLRHYGFSDEPIEGDNEVISLDVISSARPGGKKVPLADIDAVTVETAGRYTIYATVNGQTFRVAGPKEHENIIFYMGVNIYSVESDGE